MLPAIRVMVAHRAALPINDIADAPEWYLFRPDG